MIALLIHFLGFLCIDSAVPSYVGSADAYFLALWFAAFAAVDLVAVTFAETSRLRVLLALSFAWSVSLAVEQLMLLDGLHQADPWVQRILDTSMFIYFILLLARLRKPLAEAPRGY